MINKTVIFTMPSGRKWKHKFEDYASIESLEQELKEIVNLMSTVYKTEITWEYEE